jgi:hypothetical protein
MTDIESAIDRSVTHNEIVHIAVDTVEAMRAAVDALYEAGADLECDGVDTPAVCEVWAVDPETDEQVWRVHVEVAGAS